MSFKPPQADVTPAGKNGENKLAPDPAAGLAHGATPAQYGRRLGYAIFWNILFWPLGFYYQRNVLRFWTFALLSILGAATLRFFFWTWPSFTWGWAHILCTVIVLLAFVIYLIAETVRTHRREPMSDAFYFITPHAYWFVPLVMAVIFSISSVMEPVKNGIMIGHNIPAGSMEPNIQKGDFIYVDYLTGTHDIRRGDMMSFESPGPEGRAGPLFIKRVVGLPGEHLRLYREEFKFDKKRVSVLRIAVNGQVLPVRPVKIDPRNLEIDGLLSTNTIVLEEGRRKYKILETEFPIHPPLYTLNWGAGRRLGPDEFFVLGDNRDDSKDSRYIGPVKRKNMRGRYMYTYFSLNHHDHTCDAVLEELKRGTSAERIDTALLCGYPDAPGFKNRLKRFSRATIRWKNIRVAD